MPKSVPTGKLSVLAPDPTVHKAAVYDLVCKTFENYASFMQYVRAAYFEHSTYDWNASRIGVVGDQVLVHFGVWDYQMRIGRARLRTGGIGAVATHFDHRKKGYMEATAPAAIAAMRALGYDLSVLFGISDFYYRFGYTRAWADQHYVVRTGQLPAETPALRGATMAFVPHAQCDALFNRYHAAATGTLVRPFFTRPRPRNELKRTVWKKGGKIAGYIGFQDRGHQLNVFEAVGDSTQILRTAAAAARALGADEVRFENVPYTVPLAAALRRLTCDLTTHYVRCGGAMIRTINLPQALRKMAGELRRRLTASHLVRYTGALVIADGREAATLRIRPGNVTVEAGAKGGSTIRGGDAIAQLLLGTDDPGETSAACGIRLTGDAPALLPVLFPNQHPMLNSYDRY